MKPGKRAARGRSPPPRGDITHGAGPGRSAAAQTRPQVRIQGRGGARRRRARAASGLLLLGSIGVVYGDIGTSPLYAFKESLAHVMQDGTLATREEVVGIVSLIFWALMIVVTLKYIVIVMQMDNKGEGGTLSLMALAQRALGRRTPLLVPDRRRRRLDVLRRRADHAGHLGALGGRRLEGRAFARRPHRSVHPADRRRHSGRAVCGAERAARRWWAASSGRSRRSGSWSWARSGCMHLLARSRDPAGAVADARDRLHDRAPVSDVRRAGLGVPGRHWRGGALRRHGPFRPPPDPLRLDRAGAAGAHAQLSRPGRVRARQSRTHQRANTPPRATPRSPSAPSM